MSFQNLRIVFNSVISIYIYFFNSHKFTKLKTLQSVIMKECDAAVGPFSTRFMNIPTADEINNELSTAFSRKVHCSEDEDLVILIGDGGYSYLNAVHMSTSESAVNWSGQKKTHLRKYMTICTRLG